MAQLSGPTHLKSEEDLIEAGIKPSHGASAHSTPATPSAKPKPKRKAVKKTNSSQVKRRPKKKTKKRPSSRVKKTQTKKKNKSLKGKNKEKLFPWI